MVLLLVVETVPGLVNRWSDGPIALVRPRPRSSPRAVNELASGMAPLTLGAHGIVMVVSVIALGRCCWP